VWAYDFMATRTEDGRPVKLLTMVDEYTRGCVAIDVERRLRSDDVRYCLAELFVHRGAPQHIRSDNGPECAAKVVRSWLSRVSVQPRFSTPGLPWENGSSESLNGNRRNELLDRELVDTLWEVTVLVERWRQTYNRIRPHSALGYRPPALEAVRPHCA
jgi:transposase InsO family protein